MRSAVLALAAAQLAAARMGSADMTPGPRRLATTGPAAVRDGSPIQLEGMPRAVALAAAAAPRPSALSMRPTRLLAWLAVAARLFLLAVLAVQRTWTARPVVSQRTRTTLALGLAAAAAAQAAQTSLASTLAWPATAPTEVEERAVGVAVRSMPRCPQTPGQAGTAATGTW